MHHRNLLNVTHFGQGILIIIFILGTSLHVGKRRWLKLDPSDALHENLAKLCTYMFVI